MQGGADKTKCNCDISHWCSFFFFCFFVLRFLLDCVTARQYDCVPLVSLFSFFFPRSFYFWGGIKKERKLALCPSRVGLCSTNHLGKVSSDDNDLYTQTLPSSQHTDRERKEKKRTKKNGSWNGVIESSFIMLKVSASGLHLSSPPTEWLVCVQCNQTQTHRQHS